MHRRNQAGVQVNQRFMFVIEENVSGSHFIYSLCAYTTVWCVYLIDFSISSEYITKVTKL